MKMRPVFKRILSINSASLLLALIYIDTAGESRAEYLEVDGGEIRYLILPQGIDELDWKSDSIELIYTIDRDVDGNPKSIKLRTDLAGERSWQQEFANRVTESFKQWKWYPAILDGSAVEVGTHFTVRLAKNKKAEIRIVVMSNLSDVVIDTFPPFQPD